MRYLTGVHAPFQDAGAQHPGGHVVHQSLTDGAVDDANLRLLQDGGGEA